MQGQPPRLERDELSEFQAGEVAQFFGVGNACEDVFRSKDRAIVAKVRGNLRLNPRVPGTEVRVRSIGSESHGNTRYIVKCRLGIRFEYIVRVLAGIRKTLGGRRTNTRA